MGCCESRTQGAVAAAKYAAAADSSSVTSPVPNAPGSVPPAPYLGDLPPLLAPVSSEADPRRPLSAGASSAAGRTHHVPGEYASVSAAVEAAAPGDFIELAPGLYRDELIVDKEVTIRGRAGCRSEECVLEADGATVVTIEATNVTLETLTVRCCSPRGNLDHGVDVESGSLLMSDVNVCGGHWGLWLYGSSTAVVQRCRIYDAGDHGVFAPDRVRLWLECCDVWGHGQSGVNVHDAGSSVVLLGCRLHDCGANGLLLYGGGDATLDRCHVYANAHAGLSVSDADTFARVRHNQIGGNGLQGVYVFDGGGAAVEDNDLRQNTHWAVSVAPESASLVACERNLE